LRILALSCTWYTNMIFPFVFPHVNNQASKSRKSAKIEL
jgi:hypothetical protein